MVGELQDEVLHAPDAGRSRLLDRDLVLHLRVADQIDGHRTGIRAFY